MQKNIRKWLSTAVPSERKWSVSEAFCSPACVSFHLAVRVRSIAATSPQPHRLGTDCHFHERIVSLEYESQGTWGPVAWQWLQNFCHSRRNCTALIEFIKWSGKYTVATLAKSLSSVRRDNIWVCEVDQPLGCRQFLTESGVREHRSLLRNFW